MEKSAIQNYIDTAIAGQGDQVDIGNAIPKVLGGILAGVPLGGDEQVSIIVRGCKYVDDTTNEDAPVVGGKVIVKTFDPVTKETAAQEFEIPASGIVVFPVRHGLVCQVHSEVEGLAASTRLIFTSSMESRTIYLWNTSIGVFKAGHNFAQRGENTRGFVYLAKNGSEDAGANTWDIHEDEEDAGEQTWDGILVATAKFSGIFVPGSLSKDDSGKPLPLVWSKRAIGKGVAGLPFINGDGWQDKAKEDFDGPLNTAKILAAYPDAPAAAFCDEVSGTQEYYYTDGYLAAAGEMFAIYENREAYAAIQADYDDCPELGTNWYWSSSVFDRWSACGVLFGDGTVSGSAMSGTSYVLALSAFHLNY